MMGSSMHFLHQNPIGPGYGEQAPAFVYWSVQNLAGLVDVKEMVELL